MIQLVKIACKRYNKLEIAFKRYNTLETEYKLKIFNKKYTTIKKDTCNS